MTTPAPDSAPVIVYVSIGNSDDKLTQAEWSRFVADIRTYVVGCAQEVHGAWLSLPDSRYQNACWCLEFTQELSVKAARAYAAQIRDQYRQDSVAWAVATTEFL